MPSETLLVAWVVLKEWISLSTRITQYNQIEVQSLKICCGCGYIKKKNLDWSHARGVAALKTRVLTPKPEILREKT